MQKGNNSIKNNIGFDNIISSIKLMNSDQKQGKKFNLIVEGDDDIKFWQNYLSMDNVFLFQSYGGKIACKNIVLNKTLSHYHVCAVCDRDYDNLIDNKIFFYDYNCLEIMLINNDEVLKKVLNIYLDFSYSNYDVKNIRKDIINKLMYLSYLRKINNEKCLGINFNTGLNYLSLYNNSTCENTINLIKISNPNYDFSSVKKEIDSLSKSFNYENDGLYITNGHDFIGMLKCFIENNAYKKKSRNNQVHVYFDNIICAYEKNMFQQTDI